jgi:ADP-ribosyl-[dinitrogen reductase] hydrolase
MTPSPAPPPADGPPPSDALARLDWLFAHDHLLLERGPIFDESPRLPAHSGLGDRVGGMLLGLAIGDSLGNSSESMLPAARFAAHDEIRDYLPNRWAGGRAVGVPSDDTQLAFWTLEHLLDHDGALDPATLARTFTWRDVYGMGNTVHQFRGRIAAGVPWWLAGPHSAGNGAVMRIAPLLLPHLRAPSPALWADVTTGAMLTHNDSASSAACVAFVHLLWECLTAPGPRPGAWWVDEFIRVAETLEGEAVYESRNPRAPFKGRMTTYVARVRDALADGRTVREAGEEWYSGAYVLETMVSALHILALHGDDPEEAIVRAVNDTRDNDTIAAIVGAAVGALHGRSALPERWLRGLTGRTERDDDGKVFELVERGLARFVGAG